MTPLLTCNTEEKNQNAERNKEYSLLEERQVGAHSGLQRTRFYSQYITTSVRLKYSGGRAVFQGSKGKNKSKHCQLSTVSATSIKYSSIHEERPGTGVGAQPQAHPFRKEASRLKKKNRYNFITELVNTTVQEDHPLLEFPS